MTKEQATSYLSALPSIASPSAYPGTGAGTSAGRMVGVLTAGLVTILSLMLLVVFLGVGEFVELNQRFTRVVEDTSVKIESARNMRNAIHQRLSSLRQILLSTDPFEREEQLLRFQEYGQDYRKARGHLAEFRLKPRARQLIKFLDGAVEQAHPQMQRAMTLLHNDAVGDTARRAVQDANTIQEPVLDLLDDLVNLEQEQSRVELAQARASYRITGLWMTLLGIAILLLAIFIGIFTVRRTRQTNAWLFNEIAERERVENELSTFARQLEAKNLQLDKALADTRAATRTKSAFLANMSHEIRTPMNSIVGLTELALDTDLDVVQREYLSGVQISAESLLELINDILDLSKVEAGKLIIEELEFDLVELIDAAVETIAPRAHAKGNEISYEYAAEVPRHIISDPLRLRQVLTNLMGNANKFTDGGDVVLYIDLTGPAAQRELRFTISDTGIGISPTQRERVFEAFTQADQSTTRNFGGSGLGLTISKVITERLGGEIGFDSQFGKGSQFWFHLPLRSTGTSAERAMPEPQRRSERRILVVDDNAHYRALLQRQLRRWSNHVVAVEDSLKALSQLRSASQTEQAFDVVLIDMDMPGGDGLELARLIREDPHIGPLQLFLLLSYKQGSARLKPHEAGVDLCLFKPINPHALHSHLFPPAASPHSAQEQSAPASDQTMATGLRALVVDDNELNRMVSKGTLSALGLRVDLAESGYEAVENYQHHTYDLVFLDLEMPGMDGFDVLTSIRNIERVAGIKQGVPVIALTANAMAGARKACLAAGFDDYLAKPVNRATLRDVIQRWGVQQSRSAKPHDAGDSPKELLDLDLLQQYQELNDNHDPHFLRGLFERFGTELPINLRTLEESLKAKVNEDIYQAAHTLKGAVMAVGASALGKTCQDLMQQARDGQDIEARYWTEKIHALVGQSLAALADRGIKVSLPLAADQ